MLERLKEYLSKYSQTEAVSRAKPSRSAEWDNYWLEQVGAAREAALPEHFLENKQNITGLTCRGSGQQPVPQDVGVGYITSRIEAVLIECPDHNCFAEFVWTGEKMIPYREAERQINENK
jgi:hypothetical protein